MKAERGLPSGGPPFFLLCDGFLLPPIFGGGSVWAMTTRIPPPDGYQISYNRASVNFWMKRSEGVYYWSGRWVHVANAVSPAFDSGLNEGRYAIPQRRYAIPQATYSAPDEPFLDAVPVENDDVDVEAFVLGEIVNGFLSEMRAMREQNELLSERVKVLEARIFGGCDE